MTSPSEARVRRIPALCLGEFFLSVMTAELRQESMLVKFINPELSPSNASVFAAAIF